MDNPSGIVAGNSQNQPSADVPRTRSTFPLQYHFFDTHRFGEYHPHYVSEGVKGDILPLRSSHNVLSYTLKSPLLQNISMKKDYFLVPDMAILPLNWDKYFENPVRGDDVRNDVGPTVENFWRTVSTLMTSLISSTNGLRFLLNDSSTTVPVALQSVLRFLIIGEYFYSNGSLLTSLGCHGAPYCRITFSQTEDISFDKFFDRVMNFLETEFVFDTYFTFTVDGYNYTVSSKQSVYNGTISLRHALCLMRDNPTFVVNSCDYNELKNHLLNFLADFEFSFTPANVPCRLERLWAYQLVVAHYYSNDHIDFIYSAELYRQLIGNYVMKVHPQTTASPFTADMAFTYNGVTYQYDYLSAHVFNYMLSRVVTASILLSTVDNGKYLPILGYLSALFAYRRSLRYLDYFTGSRAHPLAVGSTGVSVQSGMVDVVDITRNLQRQRFLNAVNRVRHNTEGYLKGIFGGDDPAPDYHNPFFLCHTDDDIYGQETENTGQAQFEQPMSISTNLRSNGSRYMFEMHCDRPCVLIGITSYDIPRIYTKTIERSFLHVDRFDMFNPFEQFIGDQPIYKQELGVGNLTALGNFAYTLRHMEYKQRFNQAAGGFVEFLPGYAFLADDQRGSQDTINPDWIRSVCSEFDEFYVSLTGWSNASYFHFIVDNFNDCSGSRPMAYAPSIL